ncbi:MAG TPA: rhodanese-like domain-containing protein [Actinomycetota bacterium]|nr:rhodanese-like domain-containing protein [Actinomycetota bacterium]
MPSLDDMVHEARSRVREVSADEAKAMVDSEPGALIVDVREPHEFDMGHIPGAILAPLGRVRDLGDARSPMALAELTAATGNLVVTQCATGKRSIVAADILQKLGYANVVSMRGGFFGWARLGLPID